MIDGLCRVRRRRAAVNVRHQPTFDARVNGVLPVVQIAVNVQRVATTADQHGKLGRQDVAFRSEGDLRRRAAHLQNARQIAVRFYANTTWGLQIIQQTNNKQKYTKELKRIH